MMKIYFPKNSDFSEEKLTELCDLINRVYFATESVLIDPSIPRTTVMELKKIISKNELVLVENKGFPVGCVKINHHDDQSLMFGMLVAHPDYRSQGIGKKCILFVEDFAKSKGYKKVCLELLTPKNWIHEQKEFLKSWYERLGYVKQCIVPFEKEEYLITPCDLTLYCKIL